MLLHLWTHAAFAIIRNRGYLVWVQVIIMGAAEGANRIDLCRDLHGLNQAQKTGNKEQSQHACVSGTPCTSAIHTPAGSRAALPLQQRAVLVVPHGRAWVHGVRGCTSTGGRRGWGLWWATYYKANWARAMLVASSSRWVEEDDSCRREVRRWEMNEGELGSGSTASKTLPATSMCVLLEMMATMGV